MKVLIVDDSSAMRRILKNTLLRFDFETNDIFEGADGVQGWKALNEHPDIGMLITDWNMPEMNGLELVKRVRNDERFVDLPIVMVTTEGGKAEVITALKAGVNNYIVKPFTPLVLKEKLETVLGVAV